MLIIVVVVMVKTWQARYIRRLGGRS